VISRRDPSAAVLNAGLKELSLEYGLPRPAREDLNVLHVSDEHSRLAIAHDTQLAIGDVVALIPSHLDPTINLHAALFIFDPSTGIERWPVDGRRRFD
jgi:D-serine deaminase-like pyridoxal phosphate-dependent protein